MYTENPNRKFYNQVNHLKIKKHHSEKSCIVRVPTPN